MQRPRVLGIVLAGGQGSRMEVLTVERAKPALPFAGVYRLIDFAMSNLRNSGIEDCWVVAQYETQSISDILAHGRPWDMDRTHGGFRLITPQQESDDSSGWHSGNADAIWQMRKLIREFDPDVLLVLSADHIYRLNYWDAIQSHLDAGADVTIVATRIDQDQAHHHAVLTLDDDGSVATFAYKPEKAESDVVATEVFVYTPKALLDALARLVDEHGTEEESGLEDFGDQLIPWLMENGSVHGFMLDSYWKDVGRPETYFEAHMDLLEDTPELKLDDASWPILTLDHQRLPARIGPSATVSDSLISPGCRIHGTVERSVLGPGVIVEEGATVQNAIVLHDSVIRDGATVAWAIIDRDVEVGRGARIGASPAGPLPATEELVMVGMGARIHGRRVLKAGERVNPESAGVQLT